LARHIGVFGVHLAQANGVARLTAVVRQDLLEFSIVPVPANAHALIEARGYSGQRSPATALATAPERQRLPINYSGTLEQQRVQCDRDNVERRRRVARALRLRASGD
jgi:hypothetical protein